MKPTQFFIFFLALTCAKFVVDNPKYVQDCYAKPKFVNQVYQNFGNLYNHLLFRGIPWRCNFAEYKNFVKGMEQRTLQIIEAFFSCTEDDCTAAVTDAHNRFVDFMTKSFVTYTMCSLSNYSPDCATVLMQTLSPAFESGENIFTSLLTCAKLKSETRRGNIQQTNFLRAIAPTVTQLGRPQCNCLPMDDLPIPTSESECYSPEYVATLRNFILSNFDGTINAYKNNEKRECDYSELEDYVEQFKVNSLKVAHLLEKISPTFDELDRLAQNRKVLLSRYVPTIRQYVLDNDESCYTVPRRVRPNPMKISLEVIAILSKCIGYRDKC